MEFYNIIALLISWFIGLPGWIHVLCAIAQVIIGLLVSAPVWHEYRDHDAPLFMCIGYTICAMCYWEFMLLNDVFESCAPRKIRAGDRH